MRWTLKLLLFGGFAWMSFACDSQPKESGDAIEISAKPKAEPGGASSGADKSARTSVSPKKPGENVGECPAGRWRYDYADEALEVMVENLPNAKVTKEEGSFECVVTEGKKGTLTCETGEKPVVNVVETKQAGMPMTVSVTISGKAVTEFEIAEQGKMKVLSSNADSLKVETEVTLAGKEVPFPSDKLVSIFGEETSDILYECKDNMLSLKPDVQGVEAGWQQLTRVEN